MSAWKLEELLAELHQDIERRLATVRKTMGHSVAKGDAAESVWIELLGNYLPKRYQVAKAFIVDSKGKFSDQIDVVVFDRQYSPFIFSYQGQTVIPAESVYAVFEAKQSVNADEVKYAKHKVSTVRTLHRTSLPIPHAGGTYPPKPLPHIFGGLLTFESDWSPPMGKSLTDNLVSTDSFERLDLGCVAAHGYYSYDPNAKQYNLVVGSRPATAFLFALIAKLQANATVPMIDIQAYARWLTI
jgi:uncharacterized protein DUF6602